MMPRSSLLLPDDNVAKQNQALVGRLRESDLLAAQARQICILTAARSGEILGMQWEEVDLEKKLWTIPAHPMKAGREHRVPLSTPAVSAQTS
jgi:integrase